MQPLKIKGIVVKSIKHGENGRMLTVLSDELGKITVWGRGLGGSKHPSRNACMPFCLSEFIINKKGDFYSLSSASLIRSFFGISESVEKLSLANYFCQLSEAVVYDGVTSSGIIKLLLNSLHYLECENKNFYDLWLMFELRTLDEAGFMPNMDECVICGGDAALYMNVAAGGLVCGNCRVSGGVRLSGEVYIIIKQYLALSLKGALDMKNEDESVLKDALMVTEKFISEYIGNLKCRSYLKNIIRM